MSFSMPPFWSEGRARAIAPHMTSVAVTPAVTLGASTVAAATVLDTLTPHAFVTGDTVAIVGHAGSTPALDGARVVTVIDATHFSIPVTVTVAGAGGTATRTIPRPVLTLAEAKLRAGQEWADGDPREALLSSFITAAAGQVQQDTGVVPLLQVYDVFFDALPRGPIALPWRPVSAVTSFSSIDSAGVVQLLDAANYELDPSSDQARPARIGLSTTGAWPTDLRPFQPYVLRIVAGYAAIALLPVWFVEAVGILVAHAATSGRDRFTEADLRDEYEEKIAPYRLVVVA